MDAQGRGRAENIDPADQWVLNPNTGDYELRLTPSAEQSGVPGPRRSRRGVSPSNGAPHRRTAAPGRSDPGRDVPGRDRDRPGREVPGQRGRRRPEDVGPPGRRKGKARQSTGKKVLKWTGILLVLSLVIGAGSTYAYYKYLEGKITGIDDDGASTGGFSKDRAINVLIVGTDKRTGAGNEGYGDAGSEGHAETTILLHVSKDRSNATALSIPRDLITDIPDCPTTQEDGSKKNIPGTQQTRFNESLGQLGRTPSCTMRTVTEITGIVPDHFMVVDFNAVKTLSTAVGGVPICLAKDVDDPKSHLKLSAGDHRVKGDDALAFVRTRGSFGNKGDLDRIKVQQQFLASLMREMKSKGTLTSPLKAKSLAEAAVEALTVDKKIAKLKKLTDLGMELGKTEMKNITFTTLPVKDNPAEKTPVTVVVDEPRAAPLLSMIRSDVSLTEVEKDKKAAKKEAKAKEAARLKGPRAEASEVRVNIYNGSGKQGAAQSTLTWLQTQHGMNKASQLGNAPEPLKKTRLEYAEDQADQARKLADLMGLPASALKPGGGEQTEQGLPAMVLTLGSDFEGAGTSITAPSKAPEDIQRVEADKSVCAE
ncbi:LCP family protein [Streptomyces sp. E11-3]|uniref:LCP family glycopolymer transferase n=1 Tax=Streptomyces sp. E11-3 TaxID=3110112 RepID=UPI00397F30C9